MMRTDPLGELIRRVLRDAPFAMRQLAADASLSYDVLRSWRSGRRRPSRASALRLAAGLEGRGERLLELARELREAAQERPSADGRADAGETRDARADRGAVPADRTGTGPAAERQEQAAPDQAAGEQRAEPRALNGMERGGA